MHPDLKTSCDVSYIRRINRAYKQALIDLRKIDCYDREAKVIDSPSASLLHDLFTFQVRYEANQWLTVHGKHNEYVFALTLPFRNGVTLPYSLEIVLNSEAPIRAELGGWFTRRGRWCTEPLDQRVGKCLRALHLPGVGWKHASGGLKHTLKVGGLILPPDGEHPTCRWVVHSAYQGFVFVRPRIIKYLLAASRLDQLLKTMPPRRALSNVP